MRTPEPALSLSRATTLVHENFGGGEQTKTSRGHSAYRSRPEEKKSLSVHLSGCDCTGAPRWGSPQFWLTVTVNTSRWNAEYPEKTLLRGTSEVPFWNPFRLETNRKDLKDLLEDTHRPK